jgi:hypothetical protein
MDSLQHWYGIYFEIKRVMNFLSQNRVQYEKRTKFNELQVALFFAFFLYRENTEEYLIGLPTLVNPENGRIHTIRQIIDEQMALDEDSDIIIASKEKPHQVWHRIQIVRFIVKDKPDSQALFDFLKEKKFSIPKDKTLILLIYIEANLHLDCFKLCEYLKEIKVPYGQIFLMGQRKPDDSYIYICCQIYPEVKIFKDLDFSVLMKTNSKE